MGMYGVGLEVDNMPTEGIQVEQIDHPVASERDVDRDILSNLQTLWNGAEQDDIIRALLSDE